MSIECDVLVVGGGPAGCSAARAAAMKGAKTILIEKNDEIGKDVKCAEGIGEFLLPYLPFQIPKEQLIWKMDGIFFWTDDISIEKTGNFWNSYSIDRGNFDKWLSRLAIEKGVEILLNTELIDLIINDENTVKKAIVTSNGKSFDINVNIIIAADGVESTVLHLLDLYKPKQGDLAEVYSWEVKDLKLFKPYHEQIFTGNFTPSGYAYVFPKRKDVANIGVGGIYPEKKLEQYYEEFLEIPHIKRQVKHASFAIEKTKKAVFNDLTDKWIYGNVLLAGDVANQNLKPFIEGILPSVICGDIAGKLSYELFTKKNVDNKRYKHIVKQKMGEHFTVSNELLKGINYLYRKKGKEKYLQFFGLITEIFNQKDIEVTETMDYTAIKTRLVNRINEM